MGSLGRDEGMQVGGKVTHLPIQESIRQWEARSLKEAQQGVGHGKVETGALFDKNGKPIDAYLGERHSVNIDPSKLNAPETEGATFTHLHPDDRFGGTLSMTDIHTFAQSNWGELRATSKQGQMYSIKATENANREGLQKWAQSKAKLYQKNFDKSYKSSLKRAKTVLKSGPHKGQIKLTDPKTGKVTYRPPMTAAQADKYARTFATGMLDRTYAKNLEKFGFKYTKTKGGK